MLSQINTVFYPVGEEEEAKEARGVAVYHTPLLLMTLESSFQRCFCMEESSVCSSKRLPESIVEIKEGGGGEGGRFD